MNQNKVFVSWLQLVCRFCDELWTFTSDENTHGKLFLDYKDSLLYATCQELQECERPATGNHHCNQLVKDTCHKVQTCFKRIMELPGINTFRSETHTYFFQRALGIALSVAVEYHDLVDDTTQYSSNRMHVKQTNKEWMFQPLATLA
jgi:hypothetical protein